MPLGPPTQPPRAQPEQAVISAPSVTLFALNRNARTPTPAAPRAGSPAGPQSSPSCNEFRGTRSRSSPGNLGSRSARPGTHGHLRVAPRSFWPVPGSVSKVAATLRPKPRRGRILPTRVVVLGSAGSAPVLSSPSAQVAQSLRPTVHPFRCSRGGGVSRIPQVRSAVATPL